MRGREINYTFWGEPIDTNWYEWFLAVRTLFEKCGYKITHYAIDSESYHPDRAVTALRKEKAIENILKTGEVPKSIECYSVPKDYITLIGDHSLCCIRTRNFISVIVRENAMQHLDESAILEMKKYIRFESGEVFSADKCNSFFISYERTEKMKSSHHYELIKAIEG